MQLEHFGLHGLLRKYWAGSYATPYENRRQNQARQLSRSITGRRMGTCRHRFSRQIPLRVYGSMRLPIFRRPGVGSYLGNYPSNFPRNTMSQLRPGYRMRPSPYRNYYMGYMGYGLRPRITYGRSYPSVMRSRFQTRGYPPSPHRPAPYQASHYDEMNLSDDDEDDQCEQYDESDYEDSYRRPSYGRRAYYGSEDDDDDESWYNNDIYGYDDDGGDRFDQSYYRSSNPYYPYGYGHRWEGDNY